MNKFSILNDKFFFYDEYVKREFLGFYLIIFNICGNIVAEQWYKFFENFKRVIDFEKMA